MVEAVRQATTPRPSAAGPVPRPAAEQALIDAAVQLIAEGRGDRASVQKMAEEANIGFSDAGPPLRQQGQVFATASQEVLER